MPFSTLDANGHRPDPQGDIARRLRSALDTAFSIDDGGRLMKVESSLPRLALIAERMVFLDAVDQAFELTLDCISTESRLALKPLIGEQLTVRLLQPDGRYKPFHGYVFEAAQLGSDGGFTRYRLVMRPWLAFLALRRDARVWQDRTALAIVEEVFGLYPQAHFAFTVTETLRVREVCIQYRESDLDFCRRLLAEEGLGMWLEHLDGDASREADAQGHARHRLVVGDRSAARPDLGVCRFTGQHPIAVLPGQRDAITAFSSARTVRPNSVVLGAWNPATLVGAAAEQAGATDRGDLPTLAFYDGAGADRYASDAQAERAAALALQAFELEVERFEGQGSARHFEPGRSFGLVDHPVHGAALPVPAPDADDRRDRPAHRFTLLAVEHHAANNLGAEAAELLDATEIEHGAYRNHFHCVPAAAPIVPRFVRKPTAPGAQTALVVGVDGEAPTTDRDHRVRVRFPWERGARPVPGGLPAADSSTHDDTPGCWVRVALPSAGADWGAVLVPRPGTEVLVGFVEGDIDRPIVVGQLWNGQDLPPFSAGVDSRANHPGVLSGFQTPSLDGTGLNQWVLDDATGQLRMRLLASYGSSELGVGHLIGQSTGSAHRDGWRGSGFEANTQGWTTVRAARGLLVGTHTRPGTYGSAEGTQMGSAEALAQLRAGRELGARLGEAARAAGAGPLACFAAGAAIGTLADAIDPKQAGRHAPSVNGQPATRPGPDGRTPGDAPVEAFSAPHTLLDTPSSAIFASEASVTSFAGLDLAAVSGADLHLAAGATFASVSGKTTSLYAHAGGIKAFAANGPVSLRAHADTLRILADQDVTVVSVNDTITIGAATRIELVAGQSSIVLDGGDITFTTPGKFEAKFSAHAFLDAGSEAAKLPSLPVGPSSIGTDTVHLDHRYHDDEGVAHAPYEILLADGTKRTGSLDSQGKATVDGLTSQPVEVRFGPSPKSFDTKDKRAMPSHDPKPSAAKLDALVESYAGALLADHSEARDAT